MTKQEQTHMAKSASYIAQIMKDPTGIARVMYRTFSALIEAGFNEPQAIELTKHTMAMLIGMGASIDEP